MEPLRERVLAVWRRTIALSWPISVEQAFGTLMRTTDIIVTGLFSPAAVAAVGLADLYAQLPLRFGLGLGAGAIAISSQDTGRGEVRVRDEAITQALILGFLTGVPFVLAGYYFGELALAVLGASDEVAQMGGAYLTLVFGAAPARIVGITASRALQGTGDTRTPMYINVTSNAINISGSVLLGLGIGPFPQLAIVGVGLATFIARVFQGSLLLIVMWSGATTTSFRRPKHWTTTRQLVAVSVPNVAEGMSSTLANFPFNAILLLFGTEVNAAFHIGRRLYQQITGPLYRSLSVSSSIIVGQMLGEGDPEGARFSAYAITGLGVITLGLSGAAIVIWAEPLAMIFTRDPLTLMHATNFARVFGISMFLFGLIWPVAGALRGAGDTRTPFYARVTGMFGFTVGFSYLFGVILGYGLVGIYAGLILTYVWWTVVVWYGLLWGGWADLAAAMMAERAAVEAQE